MYKLIPFSQIKENSEELIQEIAEDNIGLECLLKYCVEHDIATYSSCGDIHPYIDFIINEDSKDILYRLCSLLTNNTYIRDYISVKLGFTKDNNICRINYYDNDYINVVDFFILITTTLKKAIVKDNYEKEIWEMANEVVKFTNKNGFDNYLEVIKYDNIESNEDSYMYYFTIHSTDYKMINNFQHQYFSNIRQDYVSQNYNDYSIGYNIDDIKLLLPSKKLVRKK